MTHGDARLAHFYHRAERWLEIEQFLAMSRAYWPDATAERLSWIREQLTLFYDNLPEWKIFCATLKAGLPLNEDEANWLSGEAREQLYYDAAYDKWATDATY